MCDFSMIKDLPEMYKHCKATEDPDLTLLDFFTEHLVDFDKIFENEEHEKGEKPHQTQMHHSLSCYVEVVTPQATFIEKKSKCHIPVQKKYCNYQNNYSFTYNTDILHPPIA